MRNIEPNVHYPKFPQKEKAYALIPVEHTPFQHAVVGITYPAADYHIDRKSNSSINVFEFVLAGEGEILLDGVWKKATAGCLYLLRSGEEHHYRSTPQNPWHKLWINYSADYLAPFLDAHGVRSGIYPAPEAQKYFDLALNAAKRGTPRAEACRTIADCIHRLVSIAAIREGAEKESDVYRIREELDAALYQKLDLNTLCEKLHISKSNIIRLYKKHYGVTPYEYLLNAKIEAAKALLGNTQLPIKEIAERLHISDEHYFSTLFLRRTGIRPGDFRRRENPFWNL